MLVNVPVPDPRPPVIGAAVDDLVRKQFHQATPLRPLAPWQVDVHGQAQTVNEQNGEACTALRSFLGARRYVTLILHVLVTVVDSFDAMLGRTLLHPADAAGAFDLCGIIFARAGSAYAHFDGRTVLIDIKTGGEVYAFEWCRKAKATLASAVAQNLDFADACVVIFVAELEPAEYADIAVLSSELAAWDAAPGTLPVFACWNGHAKMPIAKIQHPSWFSLAPATIDGKPDCVMLSAAANAFYSSSKMANSLKRRLEAHTVDDSVQRIFKVRRVKHQEHYVRVADLKAVLTKDFPYDE